MYQPDPVYSLRQLARVVRPNGLIVFQEHDSAAVTNGQTSLPLHDRVKSWIWETVKREGGNIHMGLELYPVLSAAGFSVQQVRAEAIVHSPVLHYPFGAIIRSMFTRIVRLGVATEEEFGVETLDQWLIEECEKAKAVYIGDVIFSAWARRPG